LYGERALLFVDPPLETAFQPLAGLRPDPHPALLHKKYSDRPSRSLFGMVQALTHPAGGAALVCLQEATRRVNEKQGVSPEAD
jgi:hypothetical protein